MPDAEAREAFLTADYNAEMIEHIDRFPRLRDRAIFVGNPDDIVPDCFGPEQPLIRDWTCDHYSFLVTSPGSSLRSSRTGQHCATNWAMATANGCASLPSEDQASVATYFGG